MFYSHEILTSREGGLATVWLIATVGSKSTTKRLSRKNILDVNVPKTCDKIINPEAPMALRLQSNLLIGVSRVFSQQSGYLLSDAQLAQANMRALLKAVRTSELDPNAGKTRPGQLVLQDDPGFVPDFQLDLDVSALDISSTESSRHSSLLSRQSLASSHSSHHSADGSLSGIIIPSSGGGSMIDLGGGQISSDHGSSLQQERMRRLLDDDGEAYNFDPGFSFDESGNLINDEPPEGQADVQVPNSPRAVHESSVDRQLRLETERAIDSHVSETGPREPFNFDPIFDDDMPLLPDAEPFPIRQEDSTLASLEQQEMAAGPVTVPMRERARKVRDIPFDDSTMLRSKDLANWKDHYLDNMAEATRARQTRQHASKAQKDAKQSILGVGIGHAGMSIGSVDAANPLAMFSGDALVNFFREASPTNSQKRDHDSLSEGEPDSDSKRQRVRAEDAEIGLHGQGLLDDDVPMYMSDDVEIGRRAPTPLADDQSFPWNNTASAIASRSVAGSSIAGGRNLPAGIASSAGPASSMRFPSGQRPPDRHASRLLSSSPLGDRGAALRDVPMSDGPSGSLEGLADLENESFQLHGPAAGVGTQTQAQSQWIEATLDREASNFLGFLQEKIELLPTRRTDVAGGETDQMEEDELATTPEKWAKKKMVVFEELLPPQQHTSVVAAQALLHVLSLATKGLVDVKQEQAFGDIGIGIVGAL